VPCFLGWQLAVGRLPLAVPKRNSGVMRVLCFYKCLVQETTAFEARIAKPSTADGKPQTANCKLQTANRDRLADIKLVENWQHIQAAYRRLELPIPVDPAG
jgi:hypothetical protein